MSKSLSKVALIFRLYFPLTIASLNNIFRGSNPFIQSRINTYDEGVLDAFKNLLLVFDIINVLALDDICLLHCLHGILVLWLSLDPSHSYVTERAYTIKEIVSQSRFMKYRYTSK